MLAETQGNWLTHACCQVVPTHSQQCHCADGLPSWVTDRHARLGFVCVFPMKTMGPSPALGQLWNPGPLLPSEGVGLWVPCQHALHSCHFVLHSCSPRARRSPHAWVLSSPRCLRSGRLLTRMRPQTKSWDGDGFLGKSWSSGCQRARENRDELTQAVCFGNFLEPWS